MAFETAVARGIALLDGEVPGWRERIDLERLAIASCEDCVLGQVFGNYFDGREILAGDISLADGFDWAVDRGFTPENPSDAADLTDAWRHALNPDGGS